MLLDQSCESLDVKHDLNGSILDVLISEAYSRDGSLKDALHCEDL